MHRDRVARGMRKIEETKEDERRQDKEDWDSKGDGAKGRKAIRRHAEGSGIIFLHEKLLASYYLSTSK